MIESIKNSLIEKGKQIKFLLQSNQKMGVESKIPKQKGHLVIISKLESLENMVTKQRIMTKYLLHKMDMKHLKGMGNEEGFANTSTNLSYR
jgi:hypothetical protein